MGFVFFSNMAAIAILEIKKWRISIKVNDGHFRAHAKF